MTHFISILQISDLHITANGRPEKIDTKVRSSEIEKDLKSDECDDFLSNLKIFLEQRTRDEWPKFVLVTGDLVNYGGTEQVNGRSEFDAAKEFLKRLASLLQIREMDIYIVPGNHDVNWSPGLKQVERFKNFLRATEDFSTPSFPGDNPLPSFHELPRYRKDIDLDLLLFISPTFSGIPDPMMSLISDRLDSIITDLPNEHLDKIKEALLNIEGSVDIAAIGGKQREKIPIPHRNDSRIHPVRIAALHHHLLPDSQLEIAQFESVLDSGRVIDKLIQNEFDLVVTGHKHNRTLVHYGKNQRTIDIYSSPSLFEASGSTQPGFTIINIFGKNCPHYASLEYYNTKDCKHVNTEYLIRESRVLPEIQGICAEIIPKEQKDRIVPLLKATGNAFKWSRGHKAEMLFNEVWSRISREITTIGKEELIFRPPYIYKYWEDLLALSKSDTPNYLRIASENDVGYWLDSDRTDSDSSHYRKCLKDFSGVKERILSLNLGNFDEKLINATDRIIAMMIDDGFKIIIINSKTPPNDIDQDFGIIQDFAVWCFENREKDEFNRTLSVKFDLSILRDKEEDWKKLLNFCLWDSNSSLSFRAFYDGFKKKNK